MKKAMQLGMNPATAAHRLRMSIMFNLAAQLGHKCFRCGGDLTLETFSIEHKEPWLDSADPISTFFDMGNIGFSHRSCNYAAKRTPHKKWMTRDAFLDRDRSRSKRYRAGLSIEERQRRRRQKYILHGI